jgi:hypothetical protein
MELKKAVLSPETAEDRLHNALLDAGVADWVEIRRADDGVNLIAELFDTLTSNQVDALKPRYDVVLHPANSFIYSFAERVAVAPLVDPAKVEKRLRQAWSNAHAGKIAAIGSTEDPREWIVTTEKSQPLHSGLNAHGIEHVKMIGDDSKTSRVRIGSKIWLELLEAGKPAPTPETTATTEAAVVADGDTQPIPDPVPEAAPLPELDERDLEINALKAQVDSLQHIIKSMTPLTNEWQTLTLKVKRDGTGITAHPEIAEQEALGWKVHHVQFVTNGEDRLFVFMERRAKDEAPRYKWANAYAAQAFEPMNGNHSMTITPVSVRYQQEIDRMNDELTPSMNALAAAFGVSLSGAR